MSLLFAVILSLFSVARATTVHSLAQIIGAPGQSVSVTSLYPDAGVAPVLVSLSYPTSYDSSASPLSSFSMSGSATFTGNNTVTDGVLTFTSGSDSVSAVIIATGTNSNTATLLSLGSYLRFSKTASYTVTVSLFTATGRSYPVTLPGGFPNVAATAFVPPTVAGFHLVSPQPGTSTLNGTVTLTSATGSAMYWETILRSSAPATGAVLVNTASVSAGGMSDFNTDTVLEVAVAVGAVFNGAFGPQYSSTSAQITQDTDYSISGQFQQPPLSVLIDQTTLSGFQSSVRFSSGGSDTLAPICTAVSLQPTSLTTGNQYSQLTATVACADESGGSGLWIEGVILSADITSGIAANLVLVVGGPPSTGFTQPLPPYVSGSISLIGVFAVDYAGNAALYGSCGTATGIDTICVPSPTGVVGSSSAKAASSSASTGNTGGTGTTGTTTGTTSTGTTGTAGGDNNPSAAVTGIGVTVVMGVLMMAAVLGL